LVIYLNYKYRLRDVLFNCYEQTPSTNFVYFRNSTVQLPGEP